ncbi:GntR family transcriptional regulator [Clostridium sp. E02]|uniref:GntR family transcriptional regulator n=1 Tax=Clostridium sp. E02 TaxID=2487134 RepID=UPI000F543C95|nr:GntR family transcriptional regulator [Clostridium sp. E02]
MLVKLNTASSTPIYVQLRNQIVMGIGRGDLKIGQGLPTVRQMAEDICINMMTVTKAYTILKNEGYIEIDRRHGAKIKPTALLTGDFTEKIESELALLITESSIKGIKKEYFLKTCEELFDGLNIIQMAGESI